MHLSPHWGQKDPSMGQLILYVRPYISISFSLSIRPRYFLEIIRAAHNCTHVLPHMKIHVQI